MKKISVEDKEILKRFHAALSSVVASVETIRSNFELIANAKPTLEQAQKGLAELSKAFHSDDTTLGFLIIDGTIIDNIKADFVAATLTIYCPSANDVLDTAQASLKSVDVSCVIDKKIQGAFVIYSAMFDEDGSATYRLVPKEPLLPPQRLDDCPHCDHKCIRRDMGNDGGWYEHETDEQDANCPGNFINNISDNIVDCPCCGRKALQSQSHLSTCYVHLDKGDACIVKKNGAIINGCR